MTTQQDCSIGLVQEATYGVPLVVTRFVEYTDEGFEYKPTYLQGEGLRVSAPLARNARRTTGMLDVAGEIDLEMYTRGLSIFFQAAMGTGTASMVSAGIYQHLFTLTTTDPLPSYTIQKGIPPLGGGATTPFTFDGCVCGSLEIDCPNGGLVTLKSSWVGRRLQTGVSYAAPSYASGGELLSFVGGSIVVGNAGVTVPTNTVLGTVTTPLTLANITDFNIKIDNNLDGGGWRFSGNGLRTRPPAVGLRQVTGTITVEYDSTTWRDAYIAQTPMSMIINLQGMTFISGAVLPQLQIVIPTFKLEGDTPNSEKGGVITQTIPFTVLDGGVAASPFYVAIVTADAAI